MCVEKSKVEIKEKVRISYILYSLVWRLSGGQSSEFMYPKHEAIEFSS